MKWWYYIDGKLNLLYNYAGDICILYMGNYLTFINVTMKVWFNITIKETLFNIYFTLSLIRLFVGQAMYKYKFVKEA